MATRIGFFIVHNDNHKLVHSVDVPWDFGTNAEDGTVIQPNPLPPATEEPIEGFTWNDTQMERMILHIQRKLHRRKYKHRRRLKPFILQEAVFILSPSFAEKLGVVTIENEDLKNGIYLKRYPDLMTEIYLTESKELENEYEMIVRLQNDKTKIILFDENNLPNFNDPEEPNVPENPEPGDGEEPPIENPDLPPTDENENEEEGIMALDDDFSADLSAPGEGEEEGKYILNDEVASILFASCWPYFDNGISVFIPFDKAISEGLIIENDMINEDGEEEEDNIQILSEEEENHNSSLIFNYGEDKIIVTRTESDNCYIVPLVTNPVKVIFRENSLESEEIDETEPSNEDLFINWFTQYFNNVLLKDEKFLNYFNNNRTYIVISQENENIMGTMTLYKGRSVLNFENHNYAELIDSKFPNIRDDMIFKDESFGGYDDDKGYSVDKIENQRPLRPGNFGGYDDDAGFLI